MAVFGKSFEYADETDEVKETEDVTIDEDELELLSARLCWPVLELTRVNKQSTAMILASISR